MTEKIIFSPAIREEIRKFLSQEPARLDERAGVSIYGPLSEPLSHLVLVVPKEGIRIESDKVMFPLPADIDSRGFLGSRDDFPL